MLAILFMIRVGWEPAYDIEISNKIFSKNYGPFYHFIVSLACGLFESLSGKYIEDGLTEYDLMPTDGILNKPFLYRTEQQTNILSEFIRNAK